MVPSSRPRTHADTIAPQAAAQAEAQRKAQAEAEAKKVRGVGVYLSSLHCVLCGIFLVLARSPSFAFFALHLSRALPTSFTRF